MLAFSGFYTSWLVNRHRTTSNIITITHGTPIYNYHNFPILSYNLIFVNTKKIHSPFSLPNLPIPPTATQATPSRFPSQKLSYRIIARRKPLLHPASCGRRSVGAGVGAHLLYSLLERKYSLAGRDLHSSCPGFAYLGATPCVRHFFIYPQVSEPELGLQTTD